MSERELLTYLSAPVICALIGWLTNYLAVKMLFHPRNPVKIGPLTIQGVFPKRQKALARSLGEMIDRELINMAEITESMKTQDLGGRFRDTLDFYVDKLLREKLTQAIPMAAMFLNDQMIEKVKKLLVPELEKMIPGLIDKAADELSQCYDVSLMVREKVEEFSIEKLESILYGIMSREFKFIELVGAVLGFAVGVFQSALFYFLANPTF